MAIFFTVFNARPTVDLCTLRPAEIEHKADKLLERGYTFEAHVQKDKSVSLLLVQTEKTVLDEVTANGLSTQDIDSAMDDLITRAYEELIERKQS